MKRGARSGQRCMTNSGSYICPGVGGAWGVLTRRCASCSLVATANFSGLEGGVRTCDALLVGEVGGDLLERRSARWGGHAFLTMPRSMVSAMGLEVSMSK